MKKNTVYIILALVIVGIMVCIIAFVIPKTENPPGVGKSPAGSGGSNSAVTVTTYSNKYSVKMPSNDDECAELEKRIAEYEAGDKTVFPTKEDYARALGYVRDYKSFIEDGV